jgi:phenylalanyl-tRNA synthetase beta chain
MIISYNWLKEYIDIDLTPQELADSLTEAGFEVEELYPVILPFSGVIVGKVEKVEKHPNADKLSVCSVSTGSEEFQVICGAPNVAEGQVVPFAGVGAVLPKDFKIRKAKIRGVESFGMICSKEELGIEESSEGIWAFEEEYETGANVYDLLSKDQDYILDLFITPNRPDCLCVIGIAREVAAITGNKLRLPEFYVEEETNQKIDSFISINIEDEIGCPRYAARVIRNIKIEPSPLWMRKKLETVGIRSINNIVDITNFVLMETGHPLHAFDLSQIKGPEINVRASRKNETFITLDNKERQLPENTVLICDEERPVAIGGIMGGQNSEVSGATVDVLLEAAYFKPERISYSGKKLGLSSEASQRFERGADPNGVIQAINRAAALMAEIAGGKVVQGICDVYPNPIKPEEIKFRPEKVNRLLGSNLSSDIIFEKLKGLQLVIKNEKVVIPTFRVDLRKEVDLIEEVARLVNFSNLPSRDYTEVPYEINQPEQENINNFLRDKLLELGINEAATNSMLKAEEAEIFQQGKNITILNPISDDMTTMRPSLLPGLLKAVNYNINRNMADLRLFEIGRIFTNYKENQLPDQPYALSAVITGRRCPEAWNSDKESVDFYDIKGIMESFLSKIFLDNFKFILYDKTKYLMKGESAAVKINDEIVGVCGKIADDTIKAFGIENFVYAFELDVDKISNKINFDRKYDPIPKYPYVERDIALVLDNKISASEVIGYIDQIGGSLLNHVDIFDVFHGGNIPADKKSLAVRMRFQSTEHTLSDKEVDQKFNKIIKQTSKQFNASLRE